MSAGTGIEWTEATWNPIAGCTPVSPGCLHCYAATMSNRLEAMKQPKYQGLTVLRNGVRTFNGKITLDEESLTIPLRWKRPRRVFVNSMSDLFHEGVPFDFIDKVFAVMALCPQHTFQVLTKRAERMAEYFNAPVPLSSRADLVAEMHPRMVDGKPFAWGESSPTWKRGADTYCRRPWPGWPLPNVWLGVSVEDQPRADERIPHLLRTPAAVRFLSCEPLIGPVDLFNLRHHVEGDRVVTDCLNGTSVCPETSVERNDAGKIGWVICGGESGPGARPCYTNWIDSIVAQCKSAGVACFVKQLGSNHRCVDDEFGDVPITLKDKKGGDISEFPADLRVREFPKVKVPS